MNFNLKYHTFDIVNPEVYRAELAAPTLREPPHRRETRPPITFCRIGFPHIVPVLPHFRIHW